LYGNSNFYTPQSTFRNRSAEKQAKISCQFSFLTLRNPHSALEKRREWDSNPRAPFGPCWFSRPVPSTARPSLHTGEITRLFWLPKDRQSVHRLVPPFHEPLPVPATSVSLLPGEGPDRP